FRGVEIHWKCAPSLIKEGSEIPPTATFHFEGGLQDYLASTLEGRTCITKETFSGLAELPVKGGKVEWAVAWPEDGEEGFVQSYCNTIPTSQGGTHEN